DSVTGTELAHIVRENQVVTAACRDKVETGGYVFPVAHNLPKFVCDILAKPGAYIFADRCCNTDDTPSLHSLLASNRNRNRIGSVAEMVDHLDQNTGRHVPGNRGKHKSHIGDFILVAAIPDTSI